MDIAESAKVDGENLDKRTSSSSDPTDSQESPGDAVDVRMYLVQKKSGNTRVYVKYPLNESEFCFLNCKCRDGSSF